MDNKDEFWISNKNKIFFINKLNNREASIAFEDYSIALQEGNKYVINYTKQKHHFPAFESSPFGENSILMLQTGEGEIYEIIKFSEEKINIASDIIDVKVELKFITKLNK